MRSHWSLVVFTLLVQSAVGSVWCMQVAFFLSGGQIGISHLELQVLATLCVVVLGQVVSVAHLGKPSASFHAIRNFKHSWLSREVFAVHFFAGVLAILAVSALLRPGPLNGWLMLIGSLAGGAVLYAMTRVYRLRTVLSWNHAGTPLNFLGSALLLGGLQFMLVLRMLTMDQTNHDALGADIFRIVPFIAVLLGFMLKVLAAGVNPSQRATSARLFKTSQPVMQGCGTALCAIFMLSGGSASLQPALLSLAAVSLITGEIIHRARFYNTCHSVGL
jgi:DMSO reductase anchor subunit